MIIKMIRELRAIKKREQYFKGFEQMKQYMDEMLADGQISEEKYENLFLTAVQSYLQLF